jgi:hypothetical protein
VILLCCWLLPLRKRKGNSLEEWRAKALEYFPDLHELIAGETGPMDLWIDLYFKLVRTYDKQPLNEKFVGRIYGHASWCLPQPSTGDANTDASSAAAVAFIEDIPHDERISDDLYRWMSAETFDGSENLFRYRLSSEEFQRFAANFRKRKKDFNGPSRL